MKQKKRLLKSGKDKIYQACAKKRTALLEKREVRPPEIKQPFLKRAVCFSKVAV